MPVKTAPVIFRDLPCILSEDEVGAYARQTAATMQDYIDCEAEKKSQTDTLTGRLKTLRLKVDRLTECVTSGIEKRPIACCWYYRRHQGMAELIRQDTGEVVSGREMTTEELQIRLSLSSEDDHEETA